MIPKISVKSAIGKFLPAFLALWSGLALLGCFHAGVDSNTSTTMEFRFVHRVGGEPLQTGSVEYLHAGGETFTVSDLNYYVTDVKIKDDNGDVIASSSEVWHVDAGDPSSQSFAMKDLPAVHFHTINFTVTAATGTSQEPDYYLINFTGSIRDNTDGSHSLSTVLEAPLPNGENQFTYRSGGIHASLKEGETTALEVEFDLIKWLDGDGSAPLDLMGLAASGSLAQTDSIRSVLETNARLESFSTDLAPAN